MSALKRGGSAPSANQQRRLAKPLARGRKGDSGNRAASLLWPAKGARLAAGRIRGVITTAAHEKPRRGTLRAGHCLRCQESPSSLNSSSTASIQTSLAHDGCARESRSRRRRSLAREASTSRLCPAAEVARGGRAASTGFNVDCITSVQLVVANREEARADGLAIGGPDLPQVGKALP